MMVPATNRGSGSRGDSGEKGRLLVSHGSSGGEVTLIPVYTLRELEAASGEPRTKIYYYLRRGLLPQPQKTSSGRSLYSEDQVTILKDIARLRDVGLSLDEIERQLRQKVVRAAEMDVDLVAQEYQRMHNRILAVAAHEFAVKGYKKTHVSTIYEKLGITVTLFYSHFPSKHTVLAECLTILMRWSIEYVNSHEDEIRDSAERILWITFANFPVFQLGEAWRAVIHVDALEKDSELHRAVAAARAGILEFIQKALRESGSPDGTPLVVSDRLIAEGLFGAATTLFSSFSGEQPNVSDLMRANLWLNLAAFAARSGAIHVHYDLERYAELIEYFSRRMPPPPPVFEVLEGPDTEPANATR